VKILLLAALMAASVLQAQRAVQGFSLPNGLRVLHLEDHEHPLVRVSLHLRLEPGDVPPAGQGIAQLALRMFEHSGAANLKTGDFNRLLEDSGILLTASQTPVGYTWHLVARSRDQDRALGLLADRLLRTWFEPAVLEAQRVACWADAENLEAPPRRRLHEALLQNPEARPTVESLGAITMEDLLTFRARVFRPDRAVLVLHGDLGLEQAKRLVFLSLGSWTPQPPPAKPLPAPVSAPKPQPASPSRLLLPAAGFRAEVVAGRPEHLTAEAAALLSLLVPTEGTLAPVQAAMTQGRLVATLDAGSPTAGPGTWSLLHARLEALRQRGFTQGDLEGARAAWLARRSLDSLDPEAQMQTALDEALGRGVSVDRLKALSLDALNAGLRAWLDPANLRSGAAGEPELLKQLSTP
jgi:hypothetical protein